MGFATEMAFHAECPCFVDTANSGGFCHRDSIPCSVFALVTLPTVIGFVTEMAFHVDRPRFSDTANSSGFCHRDSISSM